MTLNSSLYYQIFEFDTNIIQILVGIIGSTYRKGKFWKQSWNVNTEQQACKMPLPEIHMGIGVSSPTIYRVAQKERNSRYSRLSGLCSNQQLLSSLCWIEHLFPIIITSRSLNLVENFLFYETFLMDCHFRDLPDFQSFEARWQINGKSQKWQSIRNYS